MKLVLVLILTCALILLVFKKNGSTKDVKFSIEAISSRALGDPRWSVVAPRTDFKSDLDKMLDQKFLYLARGGQCFVFVSEDGRYVLKFLRQCKFSKRGGSRSAKMLKKKEKIFASYKIAYEHLREETGLLYIHLVPRDGFCKQVTIVDSSHQVYTLELGEFEFILQKFSTPLLSFITNAMENGQQGEVKRAIDAAMTYIRRRLHKGIIDLDPAIATNLGVDRYLIQQIDIGRFFIADGPKSYSLELKEFRKKNRTFASWVQKNYPELYEDYQSQCALLEEEYASRAM